MYTITERLTDDSKMIREEVFVLEQHFNEEFDAVDQQARHIVLYIKNKPVATCRFFESKEKGKYYIGRVAVLSAFRGQQHGKTVMDLAEKCIAESGGHTVILAAQLQAAGFYEKCGYHKTGDVFEEEGCPHIHMEKTVVLG